MAIEHGNLILDVINKTFLTKKELEEFVEKETEKWEEKGYYKVGYFVFALENRTKEGPFKLMEIDYKKGSKNV